MRRSVRWITLLAAIAAPMSALRGQAAVGQAASLVDYRKADRIQTAGQLLRGGSVTPMWFADSIRFAYRDTDANGRETVYFVDPVRKKRTVLFDHARMATVLATAATTTVDSTKLPSMRLGSRESLVEFAVRDTTYQCDRTRYTCTALDPTTVRARALAARSPDWAIRSPDGQWDAFAYNFDIYVRPAALSNADAAATPAAAPAKRDAASLPTGAIRLTTDGEIENAYGLTPFCGMCFPVLVERWRKRDHPVAPELKWSPDSRRIVVPRFDVRGVRRLPLYSSTGAVPLLREIVEAVPGDSLVDRYDLYVLDVQARTAVRVQMAPVPKFGASTRDLYRWGRGSDKLYRVAASRGQKRQELLVVDAATGRPRVLVRDSTDTYLDQDTWAIVNDGQDILWQSERDGWKHFYRYAADGTLQNQLESGSYEADQISRIDSVARQVYVTTWGKGLENPYFSQLYRVGFDGRGMTALTPEDGHHRVHWVPKANLFFDTFSRVGRPPVVWLRSGVTGQILMTLSQADDARTRATGWRAPEIFTVKARDGTTDLWGTLTKPSHFSPAKRYPLILHIYQGSVGRFVELHYGGPNDDAALAELGFIVIELNPLGALRRGKAFRDHSYGHIGENGLADHVGAIRQLAARYPWIDTSRVGVYGHSGGGFASTAAILRYPDVFRVAVSSAGNHDNRTFEYGWGERYQGLLTKDPVTGKDNYEAEANYTLAKNLKGKLLLIHGDLDPIHPAGTLRMVDALIKANKDFDLLLIPDEEHGFPLYALRKRWDYFVRHLLGVEPPAAYQFTEPGS